MHLGIYSSWTSKQRKLISLPVFGWCIQVLAAEGLQGVLCVRRWKAAVFGTEANSSWFQRALQPCPWGPTWAHQQHWWCHWETMFKNRQNAAHLLRKRLHWRRFILGDPHSLRMATACRRYPCWSRGKVWGARQQQRASFIGEAGNLFQFLSLFLTIQLYFNW